ncbi:plasmid pRiA4b ORF-3 family protein [Micromonospora sp. WMMD558]|uniref:plasmid pRiA4b ORF-3 family protein n=1 Tax=unclassified Micromonospora TaxID=2617518 RepID=UPI0012B4CC22|nr:plasmid pRiA4b ORF-3 family protein [Micromonospora sp. WMMC415]QGN48428.1 plasmid pRiA4b ORF-3 family protein [Micromonospora sp. WMMC415]
MSRNRRRNGKRRSVRGGAPLAVVRAPEECDCPYCSGAQGTPGEVEDLLPQAVGALQDPIEVEIAAAMLLATGAAMGDDFDRALLDLFVPAFEAKATPEARAMLAAIAAIAHGEIGRAAADAAGRLADAGVTAPPWLADLDAPVTVEDSCRLVSPWGETFLLAGRFHRAGRANAVFVTVDDQDCGAAGQVLLIDSDRWDEAREGLLSDLRAGGADVTQEKLRPADFRRAVEDALDARAEHDEGDPGVLDDLREEDGPGYQALALLLRSWIRWLPESRRRRRTPRHDGELDVASMSALLEVLAPRRGGFPVPAQRRLASLPAKRRKSDGPAPIYQIKVGLRGARPPIWRRLEVPADVTLARLHELIQVAFGWTDSHLHVFETRYGSFGRPDAELGHRAASRVSLEQVAPVAGDKLRYTYDFGDNWEHDILVEKILGRDASVAYPRCVGGRRAAPPEDCGGVWGYADLVDVLGDPTHPEHRDRLAWLDLDEPTDFDPARFDAKAVTAALQQRR